MDFDSNETSNTAMRGWKRMTGKFQEIEELMNQAQENLGNREKCSIKGLTENQMRDLGELPRISLNFLRMC